MPAFTRQLAPDNSSDTSFRAWGYQVSLDLNAMGLAKTGDSGQIDWTSVTTPGGNGAVGGYEIRSFTDQYQTTAPVFLKLEYAGGTTTNSSGMYITVGTSSDGAGNITGNASNRIYVASIFGGTSTKMICVLSGNSNRCGLAMFTSQDNCAFAFFIERSKDDSGNDTQSGILFCWFTYGDARTQYIPVTGIVPAPNQQVITAPSYNPNRSGSFGFNFALFPNYLFNGAKIVNPGIAHLGYYSIDSPPNNISLVSIYGQAKKYYFLRGSAGITLNTDIVYVDNQNHLTVAVLYE